MNYLPDLLSLHFRNPRKWISALLLAVFLLFSVISSVLATGSSYIPCDCMSVPCSCFIQEGDEGNFVKQIIKELKDKKYLPKSAQKTVFTPEVTEAVKQFQIDNNLEPTGTFDDDTLTLLLWNKLPEELDLIMPLIPGVPSTYTRTVYIPTDGGKKRHASPLCCNMEDPRKVSIRNAEAVGFDACKIHGCERDLEAALLH